MKVANAIPGDATRLRVSELKRRAWIYDNGLEWEIRAL